MCELTLADASSVINFPELNQFDPWKTRRYPAKFPQFPWNRYLQFRRNNQAPETTYREITFLRYAKKFPRPRRFSNFSFALSVGRDPGFRGGCYSETREKVETEKNWQKRASASEKLFRVLCAFFVRRFVPPVSHRLFKANPFVLLSRRTKFFRPFFFLSLFALRLQEAAPSLWCV